MRVSRRLIPDPYPFFVILRRAKRDRGTQRRPEGENPPAVLAVKIAFGAAGSPGLRRCAAGRRMTKYEGVTLTRERSFALPPRAPAPKSGQRCGSAARISDDSDELDS